MLSRKKRTALATLIGILAWSAYADRPATFSMPGSTLLFGTYGELRVVTPDHSETVKLPVEVPGNLGYFAHPSLSPRSDLIAWGFIHEWQQDGPKDRAHFTLGVYSLTQKAWKTYGDFEEIGRPAFSPDGSRLAFVAKRHDKDELLILELSTGAMQSLSLPRAAFNTSWSPDSKRLALNVADPQKHSPVIVILDIDKGNLQSVAQGVKPTWSPGGDWIAYYDAAGAECLIVHPDGTGEKVVRKLRQSTFSYRRFDWGGPVWSPDGRQMLLDEMNGDTGNSNIVLLDVQTGQVTTKARNGLPVFGWATLK